MIVHYIIKSRHNKKHICAKCWKGGLMDEIWDTF